jgi:hypothetical protein
MPFQLGYFNFGSRPNELTTYFNDLKKSNDGKRVTVEDFEGNAIQRLAYQVLGLGYDASNKHYDERQLFNATSILEYLKPTFEQVNRIFYGQTPLTYLMQINVKLLTFMKPFVIQMLQRGAFMQLDFDQFQQAVNETWTTAGFLDGNYPCNKTKREEGTFYQTYLTLNGTFGTFIPLEEDGSTLYQIQRLEEMVEAGQIIKVELFPIKGLDDNDWAKQYTDLFVKEKKRVRLSKDE